MSPLITVYITNYNYGLYIRQAIDSVLTQTCQDFELLIIDDGSSDDSLSVIESFRDHPKVRIVLQQNKGLNATNNVAIEHARGKYLVRLDADDYFDKAALGVMSSILEGDDELGLVFPDYHFVDSAGNRIGSHRRHMFDDEVTLYDQPAHGACTMIRLSFLKALGGYDESFTCQDGYELWIKFITFHKVTNVNRPLFYYRQHQENLSSDQSRLLSTRKLIKAKFVKSYLRPLNALLIIPVRLKHWGGDIWPLVPFGNQTVLSRKIEECLQTRCHAHIVLLVDDHDVAEQLKTTYVQDQRVTVVKRSAELASNRARIEASLTLVLDAVGEDFDSIGIISPDYPFVDASVIDEAVDTMTIFKSDTVICVNAGKGVYYRHNGQSLKPILNLDQFTVHEREVLYAGAGGVTFSSMQNFKRTHRLISDRVAHVLVDHQQEFAVVNAFSYRLFKQFIRP